VIQLEGLFDVSPAERSEVAFRAELPFEERDWDIGLIVGPSGCGKSTIAAELFGEAMTNEFAWSQDRSLVDSFPSEMSIRDITLLLSSVGFSSPPSWLRPFRALSNGEQFRATIARTLAEASCAQGETGPAVIDEFTSVVDRTVARIGSAAIAKTVRRLRKNSSHRGCRFVAVSCHYDVVDWLCPDWIYEPASDTFQWRCERRRPRITLEIRRVHRKAWRLFSHHHYLSTTLNPASKCFVAFYEAQPAAFTAVLSFPHPIRSGWREHRTVCLPDFQGAGIGNALSEYVAGLFKATGKPYRSTTSSPAMILHRARSPLWKMIRRPSMVRNQKHGGLNTNCRSSHGRLTASFEYFGPNITHHGFRL
jgi:GNAT superfamily N-acetyltransferase